MAIRSLLTYMDGREGSETRMESAIGIAQQLDAHLTCLAIGYEPNLQPYTFGETAGAVMTEIVSMANAKAEEQADRARELIERAGVESDVIALTSRLGAIASTIGRHAQFADVTVLSRPYGEDVPQTTGDAFEGTLLDGDGLAMICPEGVTSIGSDTAVIAWDGSNEALRATRRALPMLSRAAKVEILMINPPADATDPGQALAIMLSRHGLSVEIVVEPGSIDPPSVVLERRSQELGADFLVMGGYGHSRFREYVLGGTTRDIAATTKIPVLMAH